MAAWKTWPIKQLLQTLLGHNELMTVHLVLIETRRFGDYKSPFL